MPTPPAKPFPNCVAPAYSSDYRTPPAYHQDPGKGDKGDFTVPPVNTPLPLGQTIAGKK